MRIFQYLETDGSTAVGIAEGATARRVQGAGNVYDLAVAAIKAQRKLADIIAEHETSEIDYEAIIADRKFLSPITHPDPAHLHLTGTGLTHLGSAATRDSMHREDEDADAGEPDEPLTDSMKMFRMGIDGGKPAAGQIGVQPEWFYKGSGVSAVAPDAPLRSPDFALDGGEEPEIAGIYVNGPDGTPWRVGFALSNEFSDHVTERQNYLYLAHSKLRPAAFGPEILIGELPARIEGMSKILRAGEVIWEKPFLSGEDCMSHSIANLEYHHFKYALFRQPGDIHVHMFGTATLSFADGIETRPGDVFQIGAPDFGAPLCNALEHGEEEIVVIKGL